MEKCKYCGKEFNSLRSVHFHENRCPNNDNRKYIGAWNIGLTKETDERIKLISDKSKETIKNKIDIGDWHNSFSKSRTQFYKGVKMMGNWEVEFVKLLDKKNIIWDYTKNQFEYQYKGEVHKYNPDFYLPEFNIYIEIKGYPTERDIAKWNTSNIENLNIFFGDDLVNLGLKIEVRGDYNKYSKYKKKNSLLIERLIGG